METFTHSIIIIITLRDYHHHLLMSFFVFPQASRARVKEWRPCMKLSAPAFCYFVTNLLYLLALRSTPPPLWMVLIQTRTLYTALAYLVCHDNKIKLVGGTYCDKLGTIRSR